VEKRDARARLKCAHARSLPRPPALEPKAGPKPARSVASPGRNVFIYGDRGVGKTSLAQTAAHQHQSSDRDPIIVACDASTTFSNMVQSIANKILANPLGSNMRSTTKLKAGVPSVVSAEREMTSDRGGNTPLVTDINSAVLLLKHLSDGRRDKTVVVVDEFDLIRNEDDKVSIANLLKQVGDQKIDIQFIFCGIGYNCSISPKYFNPYSIINIKFIHLSDLLVFHRFLLSF